MKIYEAITVAAFLWALTAVAQEPVLVQSAEIVDYGIYRIELTGQRLPMSSTGTGAVQPGSRAVLVTKTNEIPALRGTTFGFQFILKGKPLGAVAYVEIVVDHPAFKKPDGQTTGTSDRVPWPYRIGEQVGYTYTFDHDWEAAPGTWKIEVQQAGKRLAAKEFSVKQPAK